LYRVVFGIASEKKGPASIELIFSSWRLVSARPHSALTPSNSADPVTADQYVRAASYADCIRKGEKPDNLPRQTPAKYELVEVAMPQQKIRILSAHLRQLGLLP
jgi:hypothetical protein